MKKRIAVKPVLILASLGVLGVAHIPHPPTNRPSKSFIEITYVRKTGIERWQASQARKEALLSDVRMARKAIKLFAEVYYLDKNTKITAYTAKQKTIIHSTKLMTDIANSKIKTA